MFESFRLGLRYLMRDRLCMLLSLLPIVIGLGLYSWLGHTLYTDVLEWGRSSVSAQFDSESFGAVVSYILFGLLTVMLYFMVSWTFVLLVGLVSSPFLDLISQRIERLVQGQTPRAMGESFQSLFKELWFTLFNEVKKIGLILSLSVVSFALSYIPFLTPVGVGISGLLLSVQFVDYCWSRHNLKFGDCARDLFKNIFSYGPIGLCLLVITAIPILNLLVPSLGTAWLASHWARRAQLSN